MGVGVLERLRDDRYAVLGLTHDEWCALSSASGVKREPALAAYRAVFKEGVREVGGDRLVPDVHGTLSEAHDEGEVRKFLLPVPAEVRGWSGDTLEIESVVIPMRGRKWLRHTLCVSSQVGCAMGCGFCETAQMGLIRSLTAGEIAGQWHAATHQLGAAISNIVFMGMGEPLDNAVEVIRAIEVLTDHHGPAVPMKRITVSTVGKLDGLERLASRVATPGWRKLGLAVSVNAPNDEIRSRIMPINRAAPLGELMAALRSWPGRSNDVLCIEYVLIPGVNDADAHADELSVLLKDLRCCVNVIPYNPRRDSPWPAPEERDVDRFMRRLVDNGQFTKRRRTKGRTTMAACGQLGNERIRGRRFVGVTIGGAGASAAGVASM